MIQHRIKEREPQYMDMKEIITEAARKLVLEKKVKKLTVKDIVEECQITRQAFYYHFEGIPDMIQWSIKQGTRRLLEACKEQGGLCKEPTSCLRALWKKKICTRIIAARS